MMIFDNVELSNMVIHDIGNKYEGGELHFSSSAYLPDDLDIHALLKGFFLTPFKRDAFYHFTSEDEDLSHNAVYQAAREAFQDESCFYKTSLRIASHLFDQSNHPNIKPGELYVVYFKNCLLEEGPCDAIGIFKSESKDTFLKIYVEQEAYRLVSEKGINIRKLDKACLIFNAERENGYRVTILDKTNDTEALYWMHHFLGLKQREDDYFQTSNYLKLCKKFVEEVYNSDNDVAKADQIDLLNRSIDYFKKGDHFDEELFKHSVVIEPRAIEAFESFKNGYEEENETILKASFPVSESAVKEGKRYFRHVLKLDKNFHVYIHGQRKYIEKGYDAQKDMNFYKLYFRDEN
jgi:hypothetical protein